MKFVIFEGKRIDQWPEQTYYTWIFIKLTHFFIKTDKIERVTRIVCMTHGFGLAVSSCHCFTELISSSIHFVFAGLEIRRPRSRRGRSSSIHFVFAGLEIRRTRNRRGGSKGKIGWQTQEGRVTSKGVITMRRYWGGRTLCPCTKGGRWHHICKRGEGDLQIVLLARFGALWCQEREH